MAGPKRTRKPPPMSPVDAELHRIAETSALLARTTDPAERIALADSLGTTARWLLAATVNEVHTAGWSWQVIADALGISRQAAHERFAHVLEDRPLPLVDDLGFPMSPPPLR